MQIAEIEKSQIQCFTFQNRWQSRDMRKRGLDICNMASCWTHKIIHNQDIWVCLVDMHTRTTGQ